MAVVYRCVGMLTVDVVVFFRSYGIFHSQDYFSTFRLRLWQTSSGVVAVGVFAATKAQDQDCMLGVVAIRSLPIPEFLVMSVRAVWDLGLSCCKRILFRLTNAGSQNFMNSFQLLRIKIRIDCTPVWNKLPVNRTFKIPPDTHYFGADTDFFNDDFGRLTGTEPLFRGVRVAVVDPFFIT